MEEMRGANVEGRIRHLEERTVTPEGVREIVREEIASLAGKAMRRLQDENFSRSFERNMATDAAKDVMGHFWGEVLAEYGSRDG